MKNEIFPYVNAYFDMEDKLQDTTKPQIKSPLTKSQKKKRKISKLARKARKQ